MSPEAAERARQRNEWWTFNRAAQFAKKNGVKPADVWLTCAQLTRRCPEEHARMVDGVLQRRRWVVEAAVENVKAEITIAHLLGHHKHSQ